jgi:hypothetical protein
MPIKAFLITLLALTVNSSVQASPLSNEDMNKSCEQKTIVLNKQGEKVGEKLGGFCSGYLQATAHALLNTPGVSCKIVDPEKQQSEYLFSVYQTFVKDKKALPTESSSKTLLQALRRAFDCK